MFITNRYGDKHVVKFVSKKGDCSFYTITPCNYYSIHGSEDNILAIDLDGGPFLGISSKIKLNDKEYTIEKITDKPLGIYVKDYDVQ